MPTISLKIAQSVLSCVYFAMLVLKMVKNLSENYVIKW